LTERPSEPERTANLAILATRLRVGELIIRDRLPTSDARTNFDIVNTLLRARIDFLA